MDNEDFFILLALFHMEYVDVVEKVTNLKRSLF